MRWLGIVLLIIFILLSFVLQKLTKKQKVDDGIIKQPRYYLFTGILGVVFFIAIGLYFFLAQNNIVVGILMSVLIIPYTLLIIYALNWKIVYDNEGFSFTNAIKRTRKFLYSDVIIKNTGRALRVYKGTKKIVSISFLLANTDKLYEIYTKNIND